METLGPELGKMFLASSLLAYCHTSMQENQRILTSVKGKHSVLSKESTVSLCPTNRNTPSWREEES